MTRYGPAKLVNLPVDYKNDMGHDDLFDDEDDDVDFNGRNKSYISYFNDQSMISPK